MEIIRKAGPANRTAEVNIWHCRGCGVVHLSIGERVVNFSRDDFSEFADAVVDINYSGWGLASHISAGEPLSLPGDNGNETIH